jgi:hypothetical protein
MDNFKEFATTTKASETVTEFDGVISPRSVAQGGTRVARGSKARSLTPTQAPIMAMHAESALYSETRFSMLRHGTYRCSVGSQSIRGRRISIHSFVSLYSSFHGMSDCLVVIVIVISSLMHPSFSDSSISLRSLRSIARDLARRPEYTSHLDLSYFFGLGQVVKLTRGDDQFMPFRSYTHQPQLVLSINFNASVKIEIG